MDRGRRTRSSGSRGDVGARALPAIAVFLIALAVYLVNNNSSPLGDAAAAFPIAESLLTDGDLNLDEYRGARGFATGGWVVETSDGDLVGYFPWAVGIAAMPFVVVVEAADVFGFGGGAFALIESMDRGHAALQSFAGSFWTALAVVAVFVLVRNRASNRSPTFAALVSLVFAFGTSAWSTAAFQLWQHGPSLAAVSWSLVLANGMVQRRHSGGLAVTAVCLGAVGAAAFAVRPTNALLVAALTVLIVARYRAYVVPYLGGALAVALPWLVATRLAYGAWLQPYSGSDRLGLHGAYLEALAANLVSSGRGLFVFSPVAVLSVIGAWRIVRRRRADELVWISIAVVVGHWLVISSLPHWTGGHSFGPRLFTDVVPLLVILAIPAVADLPAWTRAARPAWQTATVATLCMVSVAVHAQSTLVISTRCWNITPVDIDSDYGRVWSLTDPLVTSGYRDLGRDPSASARGICTRSA